MKRLYTCFVFVAILLFPSFVQAQSVFPDVGGTHPNAEAIEYVKENNIVGGYPDGTYQPDKTINRAEFTKIIIGAVYSQEEIESCDVNSLTFSDVPRNEWFTTYVCVAFTNDIINGYPDGTFQPNRNIAFVEAAKIITLAFGHSVDSDRIWYKPYVAKLAEENSIPVTINAFETSITRGEMAEMVYRLRAEQKTLPSHSFETLDGTVLLEDHLEKIEEEKSQEADEEDSETSEKEETEEEATEEETTDENTEDLKDKFSQVRFQDSTGSMFMANAERNNSFDFATIKERPSDVWEQDYEVSSPVVVYRGNLFFFTEDKELVELNSETGDLVNSFVVPTTVRTGFIIADKHVFFSGTNGTAYSLDLEAGEIVWKLGFEKQITQSMLLERGVLLFPNVNNVYALNPETGEIIWTFSGKMAITSELTVFKNNIYLTDARGYIYILDLFTGEQIDAFLTEVAPDTPIFVDAQYLYYGAVNGTFIAFDPDTATVVWKDNILGTGTKDTVVFYNNIAYMMTEGNLLYAMDVKKEELLWRKSFETETTLYFMADEVLYFGNDEDSFFALDIETGDLVWEAFGENIVNVVGAEGKLFVFNEDDEIEAFEEGFAEEEGDDDKEDSIVLQGNNENHTNVYTFAEDFTEDPNVKEIFSKNNSRPIFRPLVKDDVMYIVTDDEMYALDLINNSEKWVYELSSSNEKITSNTAIYNDLIYFGTSQSKFYALNRNTGEFEWEFQGNAQIESVPMIYNSIVFFGDNDGMMYGLNTKTGNVIWQYKAGTEIKSYPVIHNDNIVFGTETGEIFLVNAFTGQFVFKYDYVGPVRTLLLDGDVIYFQGGSSQVVGLNLVTQLEDFREFSNITTEDSTFFRPLSLKNDVLYLSENREIVDISKISGEAIVDKEEDIYRANEFLPTSEAILVKNGLFFATLGLNGSVYAYDTKRERVWVEFFGNRGGIAFGPVVYKDKLYIGTIDGEIYSFDW